MPRQARTVQAEPPGGLAGRDELGKAGASVALERPVHALKGCNSASLRRESGLLLTTKVDGETVYLPRLPQGEQTPHWHEAHCQMSSIHGQLNAEWHKLTQTDQQEENLVIRPAERDSESREDHRSRDSRRRGYDRDEHQAGVAHTQRRFTEENGGRGERGEGCKPGLKT